MTENRRAYMKSYYQANKEKIKANNKVYYEANKEKIKSYYEANKEKRKAYREANKEKQKSYRKSYSEANKEKRRAYDKSYREANRDKILAQAKVYREANKEKWKSYYEANREKILAQMKAYRKANREKIRAKIMEWEIKRFKKDLLFRVSKKIRSLIYSSIYNGGFTKRSRTYEILGCSYDFFKRHIEAQFKKGMTWQNHGKWHFDHIVPVSSARTEEELIKLNHYTNFQPLWAEENMSKSNKIITKQLVLV